MYIPWDLIYVSCAFSLMMLIRRHKMVRIYNISRMPIEDSDYLSSDYRTTSCIMKINITVRECCEAIYYIPRLKAIKNILVFILKNGDTEALKMVYDTFYTKVKMGFTEKIYFFYQSFIHYYYTKYFKKKEETTYEDVDAKLGVDEKISYILFLFHKNFVIIDYMKKQAYKTLKFEGIKDCQNTFEKMVNLSMERTKISTLHPNLERMVSKALEDKSIVQKSKFHQEQQKILSKVSLHEIDEIYTATCISNNSYDMLHNFYPLFRKHKKLSSVISRLFRRNTNRDEQYIFNIKTVIAVLHVFSFEFEIQFIRIIQIYYTKVIDKEMLIFLALYLNKQLVNEEHKSKMFSESKNVLLDQFLSLYENQYLQIESSDINISKIVTSIQRHIANTIKTKSNKHVKYSGMYKLKKSEEENNEIKLNQEMLHFAKKNTQYCKNICMAKELNSDNHYNKLYKAQIDHKNLGVLEKHYKKTLFDERVKQLIDQEQNMLAKNVKHKICNLSKPVTLDENKTQDHINVDKKVFILVLNLMQCFAIYPDIWYDYKIRNIMLNTK